MDVIVVPIRPKDNPGRANAEQCGTCGCAQNLFVDHVAYHVTKRVDRNI